MWRQVEEDINSLPVSVHGSKKLRAYRIYSNKRRTPDALTADIFALVIMKLSGFFFSPREFLS